MSSSVASGCEHEKPRRNDAKTLNFTCGARATFCFRTSWECTKALVCLIQLSNYVQNYTVYYILMLKQSLDEKTVCSLI